MLVEFPRLAFFLLSLNLVAWIYRVLKLVTISLPSLFNRFCTELLSYLLLFMETCEVLSFLLSLLRSLVPLSLETENVALLFVI